MRSPIKFLDDWLTKPAPKWMCRIINNWFVRDLTKMAHQCEFHHEFKAAETLYRLAQKYKNLDE